MDHVLACVGILVAFTPLFLLAVLPLKLTNGGDGVKLPPGPWRLPVIGSMHHLMGESLVHRAMADLARRLDAPLMYLKLGEVPVVLASSPCAAREIMRAHDVAFASRPLSPTVRRMRPPPPRRRQLRKICVVELLSARRVRTFRRVREEEVARLVGALVCLAHVAQKWLYSGGLVPP
ncbi:Os02g0186333 [Oryza sativa Japonica Group]|uniref:Os02g0186333 protein n=1 Tax=Oryza sativa subsp. japonica TaxID=39947 RepID=C7IYG4_ORYSJ|nr:Os02g0186333 [Oryza sativa Japonica Group]|eukprot:NP_001172836.1 Os02g0186333 [Oryza sativa Japonica Group]